jgi:hypothetical protein
MISFYECRHRELCDQNSKKYIFEIFGLVLETRVKDFLRFRLKNTHEADSAKPMVE